MNPSTRYTLSATGLVAFLLVWEGIARSGLMETHLLPPPSTIPPTLLSEIEEGIWQAMVFASLRHYTIGFVLGSVLGVTLGVAVALFEKVEASQAWLARVFRPIPPLAWIPFAIIWFGISETAAAFIISIGIFWINYFTAMAAVQAVDKDLIEVARAFGHRSFFALLRKVILPGAAPGILSGLRAGLGQGWMTVVAAELFGIAGIGQRMIEASGLLASEVVVLYMFSIALLYGISDYIFVRVQDRILEWQR
ncbi:MAG: ABC transporter permease [Methyloligellaceae bacterium]